MNASKAREIAMQHLDRNSEVILKEILLIISNRSRCSLTELTFAFKSSEIVVSEVVKKLQKLGYKVVASSEYPTLKNYYLISW